MIPHHWKRAPADNGAADPNADVRPNRSANTVLGSIRGLMASGAASRDDVIGELVASLGTSKTNVYSVATNEGLIDIATGINGVPAAITTPFLLRLSFDTTLAGSATNVPHLQVDNFDCGPILRRDGSALADGDLVKGRIVLVLGDMAAPTDTKVTRVRVLEATSGEQQTTLAVGQCRLVCTSGTVLTLLPCNGNKLWINGGLQAIPAGGVTLANTGLLAVNPTALGPIYYVYAYMAAGVMTLEASATGHVTDPNAGHEIKSGDGTRTLVGMVALDGTPGALGTFADAPMKRYTASYFNRSDKAGISPVVSSYIGAQSAVEASASARFAAVTWGDESLDVISPCFANDGQPGFPIYYGLIVDGAAVAATQINMITPTNSGNYPYCMTTGFKASLGEGFHYATPAPYTANAIYSNAFTFSTHGRVRN